MLKDPLDSIRLTFCDAGSSRSFRDGQVHVKAVPYAVVAQVLNGCYQITVGGETAMIHPGEAFLVAANREMSITHHFGSKPDHYFMSSQWLHFQFSLFNAVDVLSRFDLPLRIGAEHRHRVDGFVTKALTHLGDDSLLGPVQLNRAAFDALELALSIASPRSDASCFSSDFDHLTPVFDLIDKNLSSELSVGDLARRAGLSISRFHQVFKRKLGCSPMSYLKAARVDKACVLLLSTSHTLAEIAESVGFKNPFHFCREFKRLKGEPPSIYRKKNRWAS